MYIYLLLVPNWKKSDVHTKKGDVSIYALILLVNYLLIVVPFLSSEREVEEETNKTNPDIAAMMGFGSFHLWNKWWCLNFPLILVSLTHVIVFLLTNNALKEQ